MMANGDLAGTVNYHHWESDTSPTRYFDSGHTLSSFGRPISADVRPTVRIYGGYTSMDRTGSAGDLIPYVDSIPASLGQAGYSFSDAVNWTPEYSWGDAQHQGTWSYWPHTLTGDYFYMECAWGFASEYLVANKPDFRHNDWAVFESNAARGIAWAYKNIAMAAAMTPDVGFPEKAYFTEKAWADLRPGQGYYSPCAIRARSTSIPR
jgi:hypothetical protein